MKLLIVNEEYTVLYKVSFFLDLDYITPRSKLKLFIIVYNIEIIMSKFIYKKSSLNHKYIYLLVSKEVDVLLEETRFKGEKIRSILVPKS